MGAGLVVGATLKVPLGAGLLVGEKVTVGEVDVPVMTGVKLLAVGPEGGGVPRPVVGTTEGAFGPVGFGLRVGNREEDFKLDGPGVLVGEFEASPTGPLGLGLLVGGLEAAPIDPLGLGLLDGGFEASRVPLGFGLLDGFKEAPAGALEPGVIVGGFDAPAGGLGAVLLVGDWEAPAIALGGWLIVGSLDVVT